MIIKSEGSVQIYSCAELFAKNGLSFVENHWNENKIAFSVLDSFISMVKFHLPLLVMAFPSTFIK